MTISEFSGVDLGQFDGVKLDMCPICKISLGHTSSIKRHIAAVHLKVKNHECDVCKKRFFRKNDRDRHYQRHMRQN